MTREKFINRLNSHHAASYRYTGAGLAGLVNVWFYLDTFVLTWEECKDGDQANEGDYTRDERHEFPNAEAVVDFLDEANIDVERFTP